MTRNDCAYTSPIKTPKSYGSNDEHMVSGVPFDVEVGRKEFLDLYANVNRSIGDSCRPSSLAVSSVPNYKESFDQAPFRGVVEECFRSLVGPPGSGIHVLGGSSIRVRGNTFVTSVRVQFEVDVAGALW